MTAPDIRVTVDRHGAYWLACFGEGTDPDQVFRVLTIMRGDAWTELAEVVANHNCSVHERTPE